VKLAPALRGLKMEGCRAVLADSCGCPCFFENLSDKSGHLRLLRGSPSGDVEQLYAVFGDEAPQRRLGGGRPAHLGKTKRRPTVPAGKLNSLLGGTRQNLPYGKDYRTVGIACIPFRALKVIAAGRFLQLVAAMNRPVLGPAAFRTPAPVRNPVLDGPVQLSSVCASLATGNDFLNHDECLHCASISVETEI
jgi:hypothetical protein